MSVDVEVLLDSGGRRRRVRIRAESDETVAGVLGQLASFGVDSSTPNVDIDGRAVPASTPVAEAGLVEGSTVGAGTATRSSRDTAADVELRIVGGSAAGWRYPLPPGRHTVGRSTSAAFVVPDAACSSLHAAITVDAVGGVELQDLGSRNGTVVDGAPLPTGASRRLGPGDLVQMGSTLLEVHWGRPERLPLLDVETTLGVNRRFRSAPPGFPDRVELPRPPTERDPPPLNLLLTLAPGVAMGAMAWLLGRPEFLLFAAMSPLIGVGRMISQRRRHRRETRDERERYRRESAGALEQLGEAVRAERRHRQFLALDLAELGLHARLPGERLWQRRPVDDDFLELRVGAATVPASVSLTGDQTSQLTVPPLWQAPVTVRLPQVGNLSLVGPRARVRSVAAGLVAQLLVREAPTSMRLVILTDGDAEAQAAWEWATWAPHTRWGADEEFRLVGSDPTSTRARRDELLELIKQRRERQRQRREAVTLPAVVVVLDDATRLLRDGFAEVLTDGPEVGVHALCLDAEQVPGQCRASLSLRSEHLDGGLLTHEGRNPVSEVLVDVPDPLLLDAIGRSLAPLVAQGESEVAELPGDVRLLDISGCPQVTGDLVAERWATTSPATAAVVGAGLNAPVSLDLVSQGPHALVAGTTGAGKSEFVKSLVAALALVNHPDDLSFLFIDFKGGPDYRVLERLPHAVGLSTGNDLAGFARVSRLLGAEIRRRQALFDRAEVNSVLGYATARRSRPDLPPVGRLIVIADEFAELVSKGGDEPLEQLVSIATTGRSLGIHLVLATQKPGGVVKGQIDANVALRVCFRVRQGESQDVLGARDADDIDERHPGRGLFRAHQQPLVEFQCGRVGGARPGAEAGKVETSASLLLWHELGRVPGAAPREETPDDQTDLWDVADACRAAAEQVSWRGQAVPWPDPLPEHLVLAGLPEPDIPSIVPLALVDDVDRQRHAAVGLDLSGGHLAVAGSSPADRTSALRTLAASVAHRHSAADVHLYVFDFAGGGLRPLAELPHCGGCAFDDWEQAARLVKELTETMSSRLELLAERGFTDIADQRAASASDEHAAGMGPLPYVVVFVDGWEVITEETARMSLADDLAALLSRGVAAGVRAVVAGDRSVGLGRLGRSVGDRLVLRFHDDNDYAAMGLSLKQIPESLPPGRAIWTSTGEVAQIAQVTADGDAATAIRELAARCRERDADELSRWPRRVEPLPREITLAELRRRGRPPEDAALPIPLGLGGERSQPRYVDLADLPGAFVVAGPQGSGRSTALRAMATILSEAGATLVLVTPRASPLADLGELPGVAAVVTGPGARSLDVAVLGDAAVVLIDDAELLDANHDPHSDLLADSTRSVVVAAELSAIVDAGRGWLAVAKRSRSGLVLSPRSRYDGEIVGQRLSDDLVFDGPPGRAVAGFAGKLEVVHVPLA